MRARMADLPLLSALEAAHTLKGEEGARAVTAATKALEDQRAAQDRVTDAQRKAQLQLAQANSDDLRATPARWVADDRFAWLNFDGFYKDFEVDLAVPPLSYCTLTIEGLAETAPAADTGGDPAPVGTASRLKLLQPADVRDAALAASSVPENEHPEWAAGASAASGDAIPCDHAAGGLCPDAALRIGGAVSVGLGAGRSGDGRAHADGETLAGPDRRQLGAVMDGNRGVGGTRH